MAFHEYQSVEVSVVPHVVRQGGHTLVLLRTADGSFVLGEKEFFPPGMSRMIGGGLDDDEDAQKDAQTELIEEIRLSPGSYDLKPLGRVTINVRELNPPDADTEDGEYPEPVDHEFVTELFLYDVGEQELRAHDDMDRLVILSESELVDLIRRFDNMDDYFSEEIGTTWMDYGRIYSIIHQIALDASKNVELAPA